VIDSRCARARILADRRVEDSDFGHQMFMGGFPAQKR